MDDGPWTFDSLPGMLSEHQSKRLLAAFGIGVPDERLCAGVDEAVEAARALGYPVVLKACSPDLPHKSELGLVQLDLRSDDEVRRAFEEIEAAVRRAESARFEGVLVQPYVRGGVEAIVGLVNDPHLGMLVMAGLGSTLVESLGAVTWRACPIEPFDAEAMIDDVPALATLLRGVRGAPPADRPALAHALLALSCLAAHLGDRLDTLDVNPLLVRPAGQGALALDAVVSLRPPESSPSGTLPTPSERVG